MDRKRDIELITLDVLGCPDGDDKKSLQYLKENDESFSWRDLAESQNLSALLPSVLLTTDKPSIETKEIIVKKLNRLIFGREDVGHTEKFVPQKKVSEEGNLEKVPSLSKIDWGSLSVADSSSKKLSGFEEVKTKASSIKEESLHPNKFKNISEEENEDAAFISDSDFKHDKGVKKSWPLKKYILVSILLFIIIVSISVYILFNNKPEVKQVAEKIKPVDSVVTKLEVLRYDSLNGIKPAVETNELQKVEILNQPQNEQNVLSKAPPKLPEPIETPVIAAKEVLNEEESKVEEVISTPPPKEVIEETEETKEPTFFIAVEEMPQPIGGLQGIQQKIKYPEIAKRAGVEGKVFVRAYVDETGTVVNAEIVKGIGGGCDEAALEAILKTKFTPGKQRGKPIKVQVIIPVLFKL